MISLKKIFPLIPAIFSVVLFTAQGYTQNLVPNPSFETYLNCPVGPGETNQAAPWLQPTSAGTSDLFNVCNAPIFPGLPAPVGVPNNLLGSQPARTGNGYAGFYTITPGNNYREYIQVPLTQALVVGKTYCV